MGDDTNIGEYEITFTVPNNGFKKILKNETTNYDQILHPDYYTDGNIEVIDYIEDKNLGFCLGNVIKYVSRAGKKDPAKEIEYGFSWSY